MNAHHYSVRDITEQFRSAMAAAGLPYSGPFDTDTEKPKRFTVEGDRKKSLTGWYILYTDGLPAGEFGCWKRGIQSTWCAKGQSELSPDERKAFAHRMEQARVARKQAEDERHAAAAYTADLIWEAADPCDAHPYLTRKNVKSYGLKQGRWTRTDADTGEIWADIKNALLVPIRRGKRLVSLQAIFPSKDNPLKRDKDFLPGGEKRGCFYAIGAPAEGDDAPTIVICEGYATGASIYEATGHPTILAFDAGNLGAVAERIRARYPRAKIIIAADNDRWTTQPVENPGVHYAKLAGRDHGCLVVVPEFSRIDDKPTDFNDLAAIDGLDAVRQQINGKPPAPAATTPVPRNDNAPLSVDWYSPFPDASSKGKPLATIENVAEACNRLGVIVRYNVIKKDIEILIPGQSFSVDNKANASLAWLESACNRFGIPTGTLSGFLCYLADQNLYNPVANWIMSRPWDGQSRLNDFYNTIKAEGEEEDTRIWDLKAAMMFRWMVSAVAAAFNPEGVSAHGVLVLQGAQYLGKTKWFKQLVPADLGVIADGMMLRTDDKDNVKAVVSNWLVELGELDATFRKSDIAALKAFLTKDRDVLRRPYAKLESEYARRTVFFASVNPRQFLHDPTGNRRYWTISCSEIDHNHGLDMQQVWAEVHQQHYAKGEPWFLTPDEMAALNEHNQDHEVLDPIRERILTKFEWDQPETMWRWITATDAMAEAGFDRPTRADVTHCGQLLSELNGGQRRKSNGKQLARVPPRKLN